MNKSIILSLLLAVVFATTASAQSPERPDSTKNLPPADSVSYVGKYKYEGMPFEFMDITMKDGKLNFSGGEYSGPLNPVKDKKDVFDANGAAIFSFVRDADGKVGALSIDYNGQTFSGKKQPK